MSGGGEPKTTRGQQLKRRLTRFTQTLTGSYKQHRPFHGLGELIGSLDFDQAADQIDQAVVPHIGQLMAHEDDFICSQMKHIPVLRELHLHTIFDSKLGETNRLRIWQHLEAVIMAASPEVKSMLREQQKINEERQQQQMAQANPLGAIIQQMMAQQSAKLSPEQQAQAAPQMKAISELMQSGILNRAIMLTTAAQQHGVDAPATVQALEGLRVALREPSVQTSLKTLIAHVAPHLKRVIEGALQSGANDNPALQQLLGIITAAEDHPFARVYGHMSDPEKLEKMLDLVHKDEPPSQDEIAIAVGLDNADQLEELASSLKVLAENVGDAPGPAGIIAKMLLNVLSRSGVQGAGDPVAEGENEQLDEELRAARQRQTQEVEALASAGAAAPGGAGNNNGANPADLMGSLGPLMSMLGGGGAGGAPPGFGQGGAADPMAAMLPMLSGLMGGAAGGKAGGGAPGAPGPEALAALMPLLGAMTGGGGGMGPPQQQ